MATTHERVSHDTKPARRESSRGNQRPLPELSRVKHAYKQAEGLARKNPGYAIATTFGLGLGLGFLMAAVRPRNGRAKIQDSLGESMRETIQSAVGRFLSKHQ